MQERTTKKEQKALRGFNRALTQFRLLYPYMTVSQAAVFMSASIAYPEELHIGYIAGQLGESLTVTSRYVSALADKKRDGSAGYGLLETYADPDHRSFKKVRLTARGRDLRENISELLGA